MSSFTIDAILGRQQVHVGENDKSVQLNNFGRPDEEKINPSIDKGKLI